MKSGSLDFLETSGPVQASTGIALHFLRTINSITCWKLRMWRVNFGPFRRERNKIFLVISCFCANISCCGKVKAMDRTVVARCLDIELSCSFYLISIGSWALVFMSNGWSFCNWLSSDPQFTSMYFVLRWASVHLLWYNSYSAHLWLGVNPFCTLGSKFRHFP